MSLRPGNIGSIELNGKGVGGLTSETYNPFLLWKQVTLLTL